MDSGAQPSGKQPGALEPTIPIQADATRPVLEVSDKIAISVGLIATIVLFLEEKTPVTVVVLLAIGFACGSHVMWHLVRILPWVAKSKGRASWSFVISTVVAGILWASLVVWYGAEKWPKRQIIAVVSFKDSPLFTPQRRKKIEIELDDYYRYLENLGFDLPKEIPPLGVSPAHGAILAGGSEGPVYYSSLVIPEDSLDSRTIVPTVYSSYAFNRILVWPNARNPNISRAEAENDEVAAWIYACYYPASFTGQSACDKSTPGHKWVDAMWDVRQKYGREYADSLMCYTLKMWRDIPSKYMDSFDRFFRYRLVAGETVKDNSADRYRELNGIFKQHEIDVTQP